MVKATAVNQRQAVLPSLASACNELLRAYPTDGWWPAQTTFEVMAGAVLVQNTRWVNVDRALWRLRAANCLDPSTLVECSLEQLQDLIRPAGCQSVKARRLMNLARWAVGLGTEPERLGLSTSELRMQLLQVNGVGRETADAILSFAFGRPVFVADRYAQRFASGSRP